MVETYKLYNGSYQLTFDTVKHLYQVEGRVAYGVTNIVGVIDKPALRYWAVNQAIENLKLNLPVGKPLDEVEISRLLESAKKAHTETAGKAADIGTMIHEWVESCIKKLVAGEKPPKRPVNKEMNQAVSGFAKWVKENKVKFLLSERKVYSVAYNYAGTLDVEAVINGRPAIIDVKTSNGIWPEYGLQVAAYENARCEETGDVYDTYVLRLSKTNGYEPFEVKKYDASETRRNFKAFLACLELYSWKMANKRSELLAK